jgi:hypothetical protein
MTMKLPCGSTWSIAIGPRSKHVSSSSYEVSKVDVGMLFFFSCALCVNMEKTRSMRRQERGEREREYLTR